MAWSRVIKFNDPVAFQSAIQSVAQAEIFPTARGRFQVEATQIGLNKLRMQRFELTLPQIATVMVAPDRKAIGFLIEGCSSNLHHRGLKIAPNDILVYGNDVLHQRSDSNFRYGTMSVPTRDFLVLSETIIGREFLEGPLTFVVRPDVALMTRLLKTHKLVAQLAHDIPDILQEEEVRRALEEQLIHIMIRCLAEGAGVKATTGDYRRHVIIKRFEDFLAAHPDRPLYLTEICAGIGAAERTLRAACEEHFGMGPIRYLTLRRMYLVRRALQHADPSRSTVTRIVTDHGFWELGRFSVAYRTLFGDSPSETLQRPAEHAVISPRRPSSRPAIELSGHPN